MQDDTLNDIRCKDYLLESLRKNRIRRWLAEGGNPNDPSLQPLATAVRLRKERGIRELLAAGADPHCALPPPPPGESRSLCWQGIFLGMGCEDSSAAKTLIGKNGNLSPSPPPRHIGDILTNAGVAPSQLNHRGQSLLLKLLSDKAGDLRPKRGDWWWRENSYRTGGIAQMLLNAGVPADLPDASGVLPIHLAAAKLHEKELGMFLCDRTLLDRPDHRGFTPLHYAAGAYNDGGIRALLTAGANPNPIFLPQDLASSEIPTPLALIAAVPGRDANFTALHDYAHLGAQALLQAGAQIPQQTTAGPVGRMLTYLRDHRDDDAPLPACTRRHPERLLPFLRKNAAWWNKHLPRFKTPEALQAILQNPDCPELIKETIRLGQV